MCKGLGLCDPGPWFVLLQQNSEHLLNKPGISKTASWGCHVNVVAGGGQKSPAPEFP